MEGPGEGLPEEEALHLPARLPSLGCVPSPGAGGVTLRDSSVLSTCPASLPTCFPPFLISFFLSLPLYGERRAVGSPCQDEESRA